MDPSHTGKLVEDTSEFAEGRQAYRDGLTHRDSPYRHHGGEDDDFWAHYYWLSGFEQARGDHEGGTA